ncbi:MAG: PucR family transcriptional regulator [Lachnospiraceae bacterium]
MEELEKKYTICENQLLSKRGVLGRPLLIEEESKLQTNRIYISSKMCSETIPSTSILLILCSQCVGVDNIPRNVMYVVSDVSEGYLYNEVQKIVDKYDRWERSLNELCLQSSSVKELLEESVPLFGNPLQLINSDYVMLAYAGLQEVSSGVNIYGVPDDKVEFITELKKEEIYHSMMDREGVFALNARVSGIASLNINIQQFGKMTHRLILLANETIRDGDECLLEYLAYFVEHVLAYNTPQTGEKENQLDTIIYKMISDRTADYMRISHQLTGMGWLSGHQYLCISLQTTYLDKKNLPIHAICDYLENILPDSSAVKYKEDIVIFINLTKSGMNREKVLEKLLYFTRENFLRTGYSRVMTGHLNLRRQYVQSYIALDVGNRHRSYSWTHQFDDIVMTHILEQAIKKLPYDMVVHEKLEKLQELDRTNQTGYIKTLKLYLDNHLNGVKTAKELYIHRSTFVYRLDKIKAILGVDFDDPDMVIYLMISLRIIDMEAKEQE